MSKDHSHLDPGARTQPLGPRQKITFITYLACPKTFHGVPPPAQNTSTHASFTWPRPAHPHAPRRLQPGASAAAAHLVLAGPDARPMLSRLPFPIPFFFLRGFLSFLFSWASSRASEKPVFSNRGLRLTFLTIGGRSFPSVLFFN